MAAYAALVSVSHLLHQILHPPPLNNITIDRHQIEFLRDKVDILIDFLEIYPSDEIEDLQMRIADAAYTAEDIIESNVVEQIHATGAENISSLMREGVQTALEKLLSVENELIKIKDKEDLQPKSSTTATSSKQPLLPGGNITAMVGFEEHVTQILEALSTDESSRQIIPIVGMGGIGKTTLATALYNSPLIIEYFHVRAWVTVSQEYTVTELLLRLLSEITKTGPNKQESTDDDEIGLLLHKELFGRKYLIVMDDMWDTQAWDKVKRFVPPNNNGSRILVTTRLSNLAADIGSCSPFKVGLLDHEKSWDLLCGKVFGEEDCPVELEEIGKNIAKKCGGLPLALSVIGGLLAKSRRTKRHWSSVEGDVTSAINYGNDEPLVEILSLSYSHLPIYLKPCFLYLAVFPEDFKIRVSKLVKLWVAEGLIKPTPPKCLEEVAEEHLEDLISRNLIMVHKRGCSGKVKSCKIHDLVRELCVAKAVKERFVYIAKFDNPNRSTNIETERRLSISPPCKPLERTVIEALQSARFNRTWLSHSILLRYFLQYPEELKLVSENIHGFRLLKVVQVNDPKFQIDILKLSNLKYAVASSVSSISSMSLCWNLQTLVVLGKDVTLPAEIWEMPQLRHLKIYGITLPDPPSDDQNVIVLENLQTLKGVKNFKFTEEVSKRIPNLKKLRIEYHGQVGSYCLKNLVCFEKLESLGIRGGGKLWTGIAFPISLKKLRLVNCKLPWEDMSIVGSLPNFEYLKLDRGATRGFEWNPIEGEFCRLKFLMIWKCELRTWQADSSHFPCLERLVLGHVKLEKIPESFAEILTLQVIEVYKVNDSIKESAREIAEEQEELGYEPLQLQRYREWE